MTSVIFGVGVGLVILITVWLIAICIGIISFRTKRNIGNITIFTAVLFTIILLLIPLDRKTPTPQVYRVSFFFFFKIIFFFFLLVKETFY